MRANEARQHIAAAFKAVENLPPSPDDPKRTQLLEDTLSALASASWWLDDWEALHDAAACWAPGAGTPDRRGADVPCPGNGESP